MKKGKQHLLTEYKICEDWKTVKKRQRRVTEKTLTLETARAASEEEEFLKAWTEIDQEFKANGGKAKPPEECKITFRKVGRKWSRVQVWRTVDVNLCSSCIDEYMANTTKAVSFVFTS